MVDFIEAGGSPKPKRRFLGNSAERYLLIDRQDRLSPWVSLPGSFRVIDWYCLAVGPGLLDFHSLHGRLNFGKGLRSGNEFMHIF